MKEPSWCGQDNGMELVLVRGLRKKIMFLIRAAVNDTLQPSLHISNRICL